MSVYLDTNETIGLDFPISLKYLNVLSSCISALLTHIKPFPNAEITIYNIQLAVHEVYTNSAIHACANMPATSRISVSLLLDPDERYLKIILIDEGIPFDADKAVEPDLEQVQVHGYGLFLARQLVDTLTYERIGSRNHWLLIKYFLPA